MSIFSSLRLSVALLLLAALAPEPVAGANPYHQLTRHREAMVDLKYVLDIQVPGLGADREVEGSTTCLLIDPKGLVLCSHTEIGGYVGLLQQLSGGSSDYSVVPRQIEVLIGDDTEGVPATFVTRDRDRDLAWLQLQEPPAEPLPFFDFASSTSLTVGQTFYRLRLMDRFFGQAPIVEEGVVGAVLDEPRRLYAPSTPTSSGFGTPVFTADGRLAGITVLQAPTAEDLASGLGGSAPGPFGGSERLQDLVSGLILPAEDVARATRLAREVAAAEEEDE